VGALSPAGLAEGGGFWHDRPALTNLIVELAMTVGTRSGLVADFSLMQDIALVKRGTGGGPGPGPARGPLRQPRAAVPPAAVSAAASGGAKTVAFYLPQFHPVPENDGWYAPGFTEWHNVVRARPQFPGHEQPHLPRDFGFYDLRVPEVVEAQARAAKQHGIDAFCFYHYWFEGHRPLRVVLDRLLEQGIPNFPFTLCWANENWSRHWDAGDREVLLRQRYSDEDDEEHGRFLLRAMSHPLYLRVGGRPILFLYRMQALPSPERTLERWRELWRNEGLGRSRSSSSRRTATTRTRPGSVPTAPRSSSRMASWTACRACPTAAWARTRSCSTTRPSSTTTSTARRRRPGGGTNAWRRAGTTARGAATT
jgi:hypothetical protein